MKNLYLFLFISLFSYSLFAQIAVTGTVYDNGSPIVAGAASLIKLGAADTPMQILDTAIIISDGTYFLESLEFADGEYLVVAQADTSYHPGTVRTYYGDTSLWQEATIITVSDTVVNIDINLDVLPIWTMGTGYCSGKVFFDLVGKNSQAGDPIPGVDIGLEQIPGGIIKAGTQTGLDGFFEIKNIPEGTEYNLIVGIPGIGMTSTHNVVIASATDTVVNLNFGVDTTSGASSIFTIDATTAIVELKNKEGVIFPNPTTGVLNVYLPNETKSVAIYNVLGERIAQYYLNETNNQIDITDFDNGIYFAKINNEKAIKFIKR